MYITTHQSRATFSIVWEQNFKPRENIYFVKVTNFYWCQGEFYSHEFLIHNTIPYSQDTNGKILSLSPCLVILK